MWEYLGVWGSEIDESSLREKEKQKRRAHDQRSIINILLGNSFNGFNQHTI